MSKISSTPNHMRTLFPAQRALIRAVDERPSFYRAFPNGDEFYGRILSGKERETSLTLRVRPLVGQGIIRERDLVSVTDRMGRSVSSNLFISGVGAVGKRDILIDLEKPGNFMGQELLSPLATLVTTNTSFRPWRRMIRASYDNDSITVYQAFSESIAEQALTLGRFGDRFSPNRISWIKPSFLWMMQRSQWGERKGQERILAIRLMRSCFETLLRVATLSNPVIGIYFQSEKEYLSEAGRLKNRVQWDPEKNISGKRRAERAIQLGIAPENHGIYHDGIVDITDITAMAREIKKDFERGRDYEKKLPEEYPYPTPEDLIRTLEMHQYFIDDLSEA